MKFKILSIFTVFMLILTSCSDDIELNETQENTEAINYDEIQNKYDNFPALKNYNNISFVQEIVFEIVENITLIFSNENNKLFI